MVLVDDECVKSQFSYEFSKYECLVKAFTAKCAENQGIHQMSGQMKAPRTGDSGGRLGMLSGFHALAGGKYQGCSRHSISSPHSPPQRRLSRASPLNNPIPQVAEETAGIPRSADSALFSQKLAPTPTVGRRVAAQQRCQRRRKHKQAKATTLRVSWR